MERLQQLSPFAVLVFPYPFLPSPSRRVQSLQSPSPHPSPFTMRFVNAQGEPDLALEPMLRQRVVSLVLVTPAVAPA